MMAAKSISDKLFIKALPPSIVEVFRHSVGDHVEYQAIGAGNVQNSTTSGVIVDTIAEKRSAGEAGVQVNASEDEPRFLIRNDNTQKGTPYKAANIVGVVEKA
ncbi:hypothetical protein AAF712_015427 [Marasmius tenuissimus]|uniref:Hypervirulence associated protein TUDOR domain-containing protein n=1 Tax=Marasmius tenuissimus TaxID=585030 RepID=A0ABR2Z899_9AGAR